ncbi:MULTISPECIES: ABC transporter ATP-binding protein [unclassified Virgibacillus]|uniref:ATP-binding cassette domain-containing protein n=1 Tax=unclassified Virgibacillus TaxID=2620237 RepID=UPI0024DE69FE|nr:ABC transporter ATP-binding protein [Virgibacillus sp. LDC-1]
MIELASVCKSLKGRNILQDISLEFIEGKAYLIKGHNGSGKTMLLRMLCDLLKPSSGEIMRNQDYTYGVMIENPSFLENETALYNLKYLAAINNVIDENKIIESLKQVNLYDERNYKVKTFSLGMKQRLGLCQAIMEEPDILILDEPFNALDEENYKMAIDLLIQLKEKGKMIVVASHGFSSDDNMLFDQTITLSDGKVINTAI